MKFVLTLVICNAVCGPQFEWPQKFDSFYDCARMGYKAAELRIADFGQTYVNNLKIIQKKNDEEEKQMTKDLTKMDQEKEKKDIQTKQKIDWKEPK